MFKIMLKTVDNGLEIVDHVQGREIARYMLKKYRTAFGRGFYLYLERA